MPKKQIINIEQLNELLGHSQIPESERQQILQLIKSLKSLKTAKAIDAKVRNKSQANIL